VSFQSVIPLFLHQYDTHAALFQRYDMALIQVAYSLLESLLAHLEAVVDIFCVALVAKVAVAVVLLEVVEQGVGKFSRKLLSRWLQRNVDLAVRTHGADISLHAVAGVDIFEYLVLVYQSAVFVVYNHLESQIRLLPYQQVHLLSVSVVGSLLAEIALHLCRSHDAVALLVEVYVYDIRVAPHHLHLFNASGDGVYKEYAAFVGEDLPGEPQNVTVSAIGANATISWQAPAAGQQGGYFDAASLKYDVVRMPDNVTIVSGTTSTSVTDAVSETKGYTYVVTPENRKGKGTAATSNSLSFGPEGNIPFTSSLQTKEEFERWLVVDKNEDGGTWYFDDQTNTTTYGRTNNDADDWLYTPAFTFDKNKEYQVRYTYWTINWVFDNMDPIMEKMRVMLCQEPVNTGKQQLIWDCEEFHTASGIYFHGKDNFQPEESGSARIGFQAYSDADHGFMYLKDVSVREYSTSDLSAQLLTGSNEVNCNVPQRFTVEVRNEGSAVVNDYKVVLLDADTHVVIGESKGVAVAPDQTVEVPVEWYPSAEGKINVTARVELATDTYPADNTIETPIAVTVHSENDVRWINLNNANNQGWHTPFYLFDPYAECQAIFLEKQLQKKGVKFTGMRIPYNGNSASSFTFPAKISFKETSRSHVLNDAGTKALFETDGFTTVYDGDLTVSGVGQGKYLVINFPTPYEYKGGNICMDFVSPLGSNVITSNSEHPDWLTDYEFQIEYPRTAFCNGKSEQSALAEVYGTEHTPVISLSYEGIGETGIITVSGNELGITRNGNVLNFAVICDEAQLFNLAGSQVAGASNASLLNVAGLSKGVYLLKVKVDGAVKTVKVTL